MPNSCRNVIMSTRYVYLRKLPYVLIRSGSTLPLRMLYLTGLSVIPAVRGSINRIVLSA